MRRGGQNLLEACAVGVPVIFGPHMFHFEEISAMALERRTARQVDDTAELVAAVEADLADSEQRRAASSRMPCLPASPNPPRRFRNTAR